ncbi:MAG: hypothetical protein CMJ78_04640 [Planctomycetaceae bacterium]|nr:hypothetical protein [Planctomycetaceae bacterium]
MGWRQNMSSSTAPSSPLDQSRSLRRDLGLGMGIALVVGNVIGSGIFAKPGGIAADAGDFTMIISAWVVGGVVCLLGALCYAELSAMMPQAGGLYVYIREAYGRPLAFLFGWCDFLFSRPASIGALSVFFVTLLNDLRGAEPLVVRDIFLACVLIASMATVNILGVVWGGRVQAGTTLIKAGFLGLMALIPFLLALKFDVISGANYSSSIAVEELRTSSDEGVASWGTRFAAAMLAVMWAYNGWHGITPVAEEVKNPQRNIPISLFGGIGILILLYVGANLAYHGSLTMEQMAAADTSVPHSMMNAVFGEVGPKYADHAKVAMSLVIMCSVFGAVNSNLLNGPRVSFAMGRDGVFFRKMGHVHAKFQTPSVAIAVQACMAVLLVISSAIVIRTVESLKDRDVFGMLTDYIVFSSSIFYMLAVASVVVLRFKRPDLERPYRMLGYPVVPIIYLAFYAWFMVYVFLDKSFESVVGIVLILLGLPLYLSLWSGNRQEAD